MIEETVNRKSNPAITSDRWHVLIARWSGNRSGEPRFQRTILSEHESSAAAIRAARKVASSFSTQMDERPREKRDQVLVRKPGYKSLITAGRVKRRRS